MKNFSTRLFSLGSYRQLNSCLEEVFFDSSHFYEGLIVLMLPMGMIVFRINCFIILQSFTMNRLYGN